MPSAMQHDMQRMYLCGGAKLREQSALIVVGRKGMTAYSYGNGLEESLKRSSIFCFKILIICVVGLRHSSLYVSRETTCVDCMCNCETRNGTFSRLPEQHRCRLHGLQCARLDWESHRYVDRQEGNPETISEFRKRGPHHTCSIRGR